MIEPFRIEVPASDLDDLRERLARTRWPTQLRDDWSEGTEQGFLRTLCDHWRDGFDWRRREEALNRQPQFTTTVDRQPIHFVHRRSPRAEALPLLALHGWPSSFVEYLPVLAPLAEPAPDAAAFHVVVPSLPGFGFSSPTSTGGWHPGRMAEVLAEVMTRLGYPRFAAVGGDVGAAVSFELASLHPDRVVGVVSSSAVSPPPPDFDPMRADADEQQYLARAAAFAADGIGYQHIQATRPLTLGYALEDSPAGLAAWILEKFRAWSDCGGDVASVFDRDDLLANVMIYWITRTATSAARIYRETMGPEAKVDPATGYRPMPPSPVPTAYLVYPGDIMTAPRRWLEASNGRVDRYVKLPAGGHFPAWEQPARFAEEVRDFLGGLPA